MPQAPPSPPGHRRTVTRNQISYQSTPKGDGWHLPNAGMCELFDLRNDCFENVNVAKRSEYSGVVQEMDTLLTAGWCALLPDSFITEKEETL